MNKDFEYFTKQNEDNIYIEDRGGRINRYAVYVNNSCIWDCLNKKEALYIANDTRKSALKEIYE